MNKQTVKTTLAEISPLITGCLDDGLDVTFTVTGNSMQPLLEHNRDQVVLEKAKADELNEGDVPLYLRRNGQYVLHRIVKIEDGAYTLTGDAQTALERGIQPDQIVGVAKGFHRKGRYISCQSKRYRCYVFLWSQLRPVRPQVLRVRGLLRRLIFGKKQPS